MDDRGFIQIVKGYREEDGRSVEERCSINYRLPPKGEKYIVVFEDYLFEILNLGEKVRVEVQDFLCHEKILGKFILDAENGISGWFSSSGWYREVFCLLLEDEPGELDDLLLEDEPGEFDD